MTSVRWRFDQDYLIIGCADGTVYIWEIISGNLEGRTYLQQTLLHRLIPHLPSELCMRLDEADKDKKHWIYSARQKTS